MAGPHIRSGLVESTSFQKSGFWTSELGATVEEAHVDRYSRFIKYTEERS
jgi:hypothetical protein